MECYNKLCVYSSLLFLTNVVVAYWYEYFVYSAIFLLLTVTSVCHHSHYTTLTRNIDKVAIYLVVCYGGYLFYTKLKNRPENVTTTQVALWFIISLTFLSTVFLYYYGYMTSSLCFCEDSSSADYVHAFLHFVCSSGHLCITIL